MPVLRYFSSIAQPTTLSGSISAGTTSITVGATTGFPPTTPYTLALDYGASAEELVDVTGVAGTTLTVTRAVDGTSAQSHSLGAVVRHVASGRDFSDYQTHQAATAAIHGVSGTLVGTSDTQTLSNKTLTSPTINSAALSGTFTGAVNFSGASTFSAAVAFTGDPKFQGASSSTEAARVEASGDSVSRLSVRADGKLSWGSGSGAADTVLYRDGVDALASDDLFRVYRSNATDAAHSALVGADTNARWYTQADGKQFWGPGNAAQDTNLYRSAADTLKTDDAFVAGGNVTVGGDLKLVNGTTIYRNQPVAAGVTVANTTTETVVGTFTIPANDAVVGAIYRFKMVANVSFLASAVLNWRARLGGLAGTLLANAGPTTLSGTGQTNKESVVETDLVCVSTGAAGTWFAMLHEIRNTTQTGSVGEVQLGSSDGTVTVDTTVSEAFVITAQWGAASASNSLTARCTFERVA